MENVIEDLEESTMKKRIISAIIALIISLPLVYIGGIPFYVFALFLSLIAFKEILDLVIKDDYWVRLVSFICFLFLVGASITKNSFDNLLDFKILGVVLLIYGSLALIKHRSQEFDIEKCFYLIGITIFLGTAFSSLIILRNMSLYYFIYIFLISIMTDIFAHSIGTLFGKNKINEISPNKSWEGCLGGTFFGTLISVLFYLIMINQDINIFLLILITIFLSIIGQLGDLFFSLVKRNYNIKDFSNIMPGHGGILDRFDSVIFLALAFVYFINFLI